MWGVLVHSPKWSIPEQTSRNSPRQRFMSSTFQWEVSQEKESGWSSRGFCWVWCLIYSSLRGRRQSTENGSLSSGPQRLPVWPNVLLLLLQQSLGHCLTETFIMAVLLCLYVLPSIYLKAHNRVIPFLRSHNISAVQWCTWWLLGDYYRLFQCD